METSLETKKENALAMTTTMQDIGVTAQDLVIPKLLLMQNTSEYVGDGKVKMGDVVNSQTLEVLSDTTRALGIIPLKLYKTWRVYDLSGSQPKFLRQEAITAENASLPWEAYEEGIPIRRDLCMNFFILLLAEVEKGEAFPCVVSFKRTSIQAGKQLATHLFKMAALGRLPYSQSIELKVTRQKKETNTYAVFEIGKGTEATAEAKATAEKWLGLLSSLTYKVDEEREEEPVAPPQAPLVVGDDQAEMKF